LRDLISTIDNAKYVLTNISKRELLIENPKTERKSLIKLENQIDEITMSNKWVGKPSEMEPEMQSDEKKKTSSRLDDDEKFLYMLERNRRR